MTATTTVLDRYMVKRPSSVMWQLRKSVPADVQLAFGRSVVTKSLGTSNDRDATKAALALLDELEEHWAEIRSKGATKGSRSATRSSDSGEPPTHAKHAVIRAAYEQVRLRFDAHYDSLHLADPEAHRRGTERRRLEAAELQRQVRRGELQRFESPTAKQLAKLGYDAEYESDWFHMLVREFATAVLDAQEVALRVDEGHLDPKPTTDVVRRAIRNDDPTVSLSTISFSPLAEQFMKQWLAGRNGEKQTNTEQQKRATLRLFGGFFGDRSISEVRPEHAAEFFDKVRLLDPRAQTQSAG